jgi:hypothetical protein
MGESRGAHRRRLLVVVGGAVMVLLVGTAVGVLVARPSTSGSATRLVGARHLALAVPVTWKTEVQDGSFCPAIEPHTVDFYTPLGDGQGVGSCAVQGGASWPAEDSVSVYAIKKSTGGARLAHRSPTGMIGGMPYYLLDSRQTGPGVARRLVVPAAGVDFLVGAATRDAADALLATIRTVPAGTQLR